MGLRLNCVKRAQGFTLIELLVVMVLLGLLSGIAATTIGGGNQVKELRNEAERLHALLRMASEEAVFSNTEIGAYIDTDSYEFLVYDEQSLKWEAASQAFLRRRELPEWLLIDYQRDISDSNNKRRELKVASSESREFDVQDAETSKTPSFMLLSSGEVTPFVVAMEVDKDPDSRIEIKVDDDNQIILSGFGNEDD